MAYQDNHQNAISQNRRIIGVSNTFLKGQPMLSHAEEDIKGLLDEISSLLLIPYALDDMDEYARTLGEGFKRMGFSRVDAIHQHAGKELEAIEAAEAIYIGGGSTPRLVANLHGLKQANGEWMDQRKQASRVSLISAIRKRVGEGMPIMGASAGLNVMFGDIRSTNDMHIAVWQLPSGAAVSRLDALGLFPDHLSANPHYLDKIHLSDTEMEAVRSSGLPPEITRKFQTILDHQGESRAERLERIIQMDPSRKVLALREGAYLLVNGRQMQLKGTTGALLFQSGEPPKPLAKGDDLGYLLAG
jgi:dipeptidase E